MAEGFGKITSILGPVMFGALLGYTGGIIAPLTVIAVVMAAGGVFLAGVGPETKGQTFA
jgi:MFS-type transporter involved in bile tolerance (Atg22 family)